jgi:hypothetical protein
MVIRCNLSALMGKNCYHIQEVFEKTELALIIVSKLYMQCVLEI